MAKPSLKLRRSDLLDLFPDDFLMRKEVSDFLDDLVGEISTIILKLHSVYSFQHPTYKHSHAVCFVKILSFFHLPENRELAANTIAIGFTPGTCSYVLYKFFSNYTCTSLKLLVVESFQQVLKISI